MSKLTEQEKRAREREALCVEYVMRTENGREFVWSLLSKFGLYRSSPAIDPTQLALYEGKRQAALQLLALITDHAEETYFTMLKEAMNRAKLEEKNHDNTNDSRQFPDSVSALDSIVGGSYLADSSDSGPDGL